MKTRTFYEAMGRVTLRITSKDAKSASHRGQCDADVLALSKKPYIKKQLESLNLSDLREALKEYGAWDDADLMDVYANLQRILWLACGDIVEQSISRAAGKNKNFNRED